MRQFYLFLTLLLSHNTLSFAQSLDIHTSFFTALDFSPRWRLGVEYNTNPGKFAYNIDVGYGNYALNKFRIDESKWGTDYQFLEIRPEVKYFFAKNVGYTGRFIRPPFTPNRPGAHNVSMYTGIELFFLRLNNTFEDDYYVTPSATTFITYDSSLFHKQKIGGHLKYGAQYTNGRFVVDNSLGIGLAHRNRFSTGTVNPQAVIPFEKRGEFYTPGHRRIGKSIIWHFTLNIRVGFILWRKEN